MKNDIIRSYLRNYRRSPRRYCIEKGVLNIFVKFTGKHLCQSLFFNKVAGLRPEKARIISSLEGNY